MKSTAEVTYYVRSTSGSCVYNLYFLFRLVTVSKRHKQQYEVSAVVQMAVGINTNRPMLGCNIWRGKIPNSRNGYFSLKQTSAVGKINYWRRWKKPNK